MVCRRSSGIGVAMSRMRCKLGLLCSRDCGLWRRDGLCAVLCFLGTPYWGDAVCDHEASVLQSFQCHDYSAFQSFWLETIVA